MKNLACTLALIIISLFAVLSVKALCPVYKTSIAWQVGTTIHGYSATEVPCQNIYYENPGVQTVFMENATLLDFGYAEGDQNNPAELYFVDNSPDNGKTYCLFSDHYLVSFYIVMVEEFNSGWYWYDPWRLGFIGIGSGGYEITDYWGGGFNYVYVWETSLRNVGSTSSCVTYNSGEPPPPFDPNSGCPTGYTSLGGIIASEPTAGVIGNRIVAFARGTDNALYFQHSTGGAFSGWLSLGGGTYQAPKSTVINGTLYLEVVGTDNNNYYKMTNDGINFSNWIQGTGDAFTTPIVDFNGFTYNFARGEGGSQPALCLETSTAVPSIRIKSPYKTGFIQNSTQRAMLGAKIPLNTIVTGVTAGGIYEWKLDGNVIGANSSSLEQAITTLGNHTLTVKYTKGSVTTPPATVTLNIDTPKKPAPGYGDFFEGRQNEPSVLDNPGCDEFSLDYYFTTGCYSLAYGQGIIITAQVNENRQEIAKEIISNRNESKLKIVQIVKSELKKIHSTTGECKKLTTFDKPKPWMLDGSDPYGLPESAAIGNLDTKTFPDLSEANVRTFDTPSLRLTNGYNFVLDDRFESYLVYYTGTDANPQNEKAIAVLEWSWGGSTRFVPNGALGIHEEVPGTIFPVVTGSELIIQGNVLTPTNQGTGIRDYDRNTIQSFVDPAKSNFQHPNWQPCQ